MKKQLSLLLAAGMTAGLLAGCGGATSSTATASAATSTPSEATGETTSEATDITMWTYPIGQFGDADTVNSMIAKFQETHPEINVTVEYLDYTRGSRRAAVHQRGRHLDHRELREGPAGPEGQRR